MFLTRLFNAILFSIILLGEGCDAKRIYSKAVIAANIQSNVYDNIRVVGNEGESSDRKPSYNKVSSTTFKSFTPRSFGKDLDIKQCPKVTCDFSIVFVLDSSSTVTQLGFQDEIFFINTLMEIMTVQAKSYDVEVCAGIVNYATRVKVPVNPCCRNSLCTIVKAMEGEGREIPYLRGGTNTATALKAARKLSLATRSRKRVVFLITDGKYNYGGSPIEVARSMREHDDIDIVALGVGNDIDDDELIGISGYNYVYTINEFDEFRDLSLILLETNEIGDKVTNTFSEACKKDTSKMKDTCEVDEESDEKETENQECTWMSAGACRRCKQRFKCVSGAGVEVKSETRSCNCFYGRTSNRLMSYTGPKRGPSNILYELRKNNNYKQAI